MDPVMRIGSPWYYSYFAGRGRELLAETLGDVDPFTLPAPEIVERVLAGGYTPDLESGRRRPFSLTGLIDSVIRDGQKFLVSTDAEAETIGVQEMREDAYEQAE